ncbi:MAG: AfsR/SARP family transcriptional regulator [Longimicrobiales bacterium]
MTIRLLTLGGLFGQHGDAELDWLRSQWLRAALLTYLTLERKATRETLQAMFWPESDSESAAHRLSQTVYAVRRALGDDCIETRGRELHAGAHLEADVLDFERAIQAGRLDQAIALYRGPFLLGVHLASTTGFENWVDVTRAHHARLFRKACRAEVDARASVGNMPGAIVVARAWVAPDPLDDEAQHRLIELLAQMGHRTEALKQYEAYTKLLEADELQPLDQTRELIATLDRTPSAPAAPQSKVLTAAPAPKVEPPVTIEPATLPARKRWSRGRAVGAAVLAGLALSAIGFAIITNDADVFVPQPDLAIAILPVQAASAGGELDWLESGGLVNQLSSELNEVIGLDMRPTDNIVVRQRQGLSLDSIALVVPVDYFIRITLSKTGPDSMLVTLELVESGKLSVSAGTVRVQLRENSLENLGQLVADKLRPMLGARVQARQLERGLIHLVALDRRRQAEHHRLDAIQLIGSDPVGAQRALDAASNRLIESQNIDPNWPAPRLARAILSHNRALLILSESGGRDRPGVRNALNQGIAIVDSVLSIRKWSQFPPALALRARLRWTRIQLADRDAPNVSWPSIHRPMTCNAL